jgi:hypothetical protein
VLCACVQIRGLRPRWNEGSNKSSDRESASRVLWVNNHMALRSHEEEMLTECFALITQIFSDLPNRDWVLEDLYARGTVHENPGLLLMMVMIFGWKDMPGFALRDGETVPVMTNFEREEAEDDGTAGIFGGTADDDLLSRLRGWNLSTVTLGEDVRVRTFANRKSAIAAAKHVCCAAQCIGD